MHPSMANQDDKAKAAPHGQTPRKTCGAKTRTCQCGHHRNDHAGKAGRCFHCGEKCETFRHRACRVTTGLNRQTGRCKTHKGNSGMTGPVHPSWKHGRRGTTIKHKALRHDFYAALSDHGLMKLHQDIAMVDALMADLTKRLAEGKVVPDKTRGELLKLIDTRRMLVGEAVRMETKLIQTVTVAQYTAGVIEFMKVIRFACTQSDGKIDAPKLLQCRQMVRDINSATIGNPEAQPADVVDGVVIGESDT